jgi:hypothetical protein
MKLLVRGHLSHLRRADDNRGRNHFGTSCTQIVRRSHQTFTLVKTGVEDFAKALFTRVRAQLKGASIA